MRNFGKPFYVQLSQFSGIRENLVGFLTESGSLWSVELGEFVEDCKRLKNSGIHEAFVDKHRKIHQTFPCSKRQSPWVISLVASSNSLRT